MNNQKQTLTKYEIARIIGARALQISMNAPLILKVDNEKLEEINYNPIEIAKLEFEEGVLPITVIRPLPGQESNLEEKEKEIEKEERIEEAEKNIEEEVPSEEKEEVPSDEKEEVVEELLDEGEEPEDIEDKRDQMDKEIDTVEGLINEEAEED